MRLGYALLVLAGVAAAQEVSRSDLARAYLRFEAALEADRPEDLGPTSRGIDRIAKALLSGDYGAALDILDNLTAELSGTRPPALRARPVPRVVAAGESARLVVDRIREGSGEWTVRLRNHRGQVVWERAAEPGSFAVPALPGGAYACELVDGDGRAWEEAPLFVAARPLDEVRRELEARLAKLRGADQPLASLRRRVALLVPDPSPELTTHVLVDPLALAREVAAEVAALEGGTDPYGGRAGEIWRVAAKGGSQVPLRIYAPRTATGPDPVPLVIALHGAGGDENLFFHGLGRGRLKTLADEHGFVAVTPLTYPLAASPALLDAVLDVATESYPVDPKRVYLLGHSLGAMTAAQLLGQRPDRFAAAACIAGGGLAPKDVPLLLVGGGEDPLFPPWRLKPVAEAGRAVGATVEMRVLPRLGHTLVVGEALPEVVAWLLTHARGPR